MIHLSDSEAGVMIPLRVSPGAARTRAGGEHAGRWRIYVQAPPEKDRANKAVCGVVARAMGVRRGAVTVVSGEAGRDKRVRVEDVDAPTARARLVELGLDAEVKA